MKNNSSDIIYGNCIRIYNPIAVIPLVFTGDITASTLITKVDTVRYLALQLTINGSQFLDLASDWLGILDEFDTEIYTLSNARPIWTGVAGVFNYLSCPATVENVAFTYTTTPTLYRNVHFVGYKFTLP